MTNKAWPTLDEGERQVKKDSRQACGRELRAVKVLLGSLLDGFSRLGSVTFDLEQYGAHCVQSLYSIRSFNSLRSAHELVQVGYYSQAVMLVRSSLEDLLVCYRCDKDPALVRRLFEGKEEQFNFSAMARAEGDEFATWWLDKYRDLSVFTHPRSPGLYILVPPVEATLRLGPYFDRDTLLAVVHYLLMILIHFLRLFFPILKSRNPSTAEEWAAPTLRRIRKANKLILQIGEELEPEGLLAMKEAMLVPDTEKITLEEYKRQRARRTK